MLEKLKSRKFWFTVAGTVLPILVQASTNEVTWAYALGMSIMALLTGLGIIGYEDAQKLKANSELEKAKLAATSKE